MPANKKLKWQVPFLLVLIVGTCSDPSEAGSLSNRPGTDIRNHV